MFMFVVIVAPCTKFHAVGGVGGLYFISAGQLQMGSIQR